MRVFFIPIALMVIFPLAGWAQSSNDLRRWQQYERQKEIEKYQHPDQESQQKNTTEKQSSNTIIISSPEDLKEGEGQVCLPRQDLVKLYEQLEKMQSQGQLLQQRIDKAQDFSAAFRGPVLGRILAAIKDERVKHAASGMVDNFDLKLLVILELIAVILVFFLRNWLTGRTETFFQRIKVSVFSTLLLMVLAFVVCPYLVFKGPYFEFLGQMIRIIRETPPT